MPSNPVTSIPRPPSGHRKQAGPGTAEPKHAITRVHLHSTARDFDELVVLSGDHAFTELVKGAKNAGLKTHVSASAKFAGQDNFSRELAKVSDIQSRIKHRPQALAKAS